jgi:hypothetical protein
MKKILFVLLAALLLLTSCAGTDTDKDKTDENTLKASSYAVKDTVSALLESEVLADSIVYQNATDTELDGDYLDYYFGNSALLDGVDSYALLISPTTSVAEVGIFKISDEKAKTALKKAFETRKENLIQTHTNYSADDLAIANGLVTGSFDDVVYYVATTSNSEVEAIIKK